MPYKDTAEARRRRHERANERARIYGREVFPTSLKHLDAGPLLDLVDEVARLDPLHEERGEKGLLRDLGLSPREVSRMRASGHVTLDMADRWCARLGAPLYRIYPHVYELEVPA